MRKYIAAEIKATFKRKITFQYTMGIFILCLLANFAMIAFRKIYGTNDGSYANNLIGFAPQFFFIPYYSTIFIADIVFGKEYPNPHIKTGITNGLSRMKLYLGKLLSAFVIGAFFLIIAIVAFLGITFLFLAADGSIVLYTITDFCQIALFAVPLWIAGVSIGNMSLFLVKKKRDAYLIFIGLVVIIPRIIIWLASEAIAFWPCKMLRDYVLLTPRFKDLPFYATRNLTQIIVLSVIFTIVSSIIGLYAFQKKEI